MPDSGFPSTSTSPPAWGKSPIMALSVVVFPQPFAPMMHTNSPRSTENDTPWTISTGFFLPYPHRRSLTFSTAISATPSYYV